ncbi:MAG: glycosyltransferase [candidate division NC10 bacterium]|nr:glycosyltransferase [candidate division NC10 bacterium]MDE2321242.1 glycosyltransferase [candidate division NC10 bacterium]
MHQSKIMCVLGMHRSGTSLIMRILNLLGVYLGPEAHLMPPSQDNAKGYWEHQQLTDLNDELLSTLGGSWHEPPAFLPGWENMPALAELRQRTRALIRRDFGGAPLWGWKDPRTCLTLPFWQRLLPPMAYVICLRNPVDVARSLHRRDGFPFEKGVNLWLAHVQSALDHTAGAARLFLIYEDMMERWPEELARVARFLGRPELAEQAEIRAAVKAFVDDALHHHRTVLIDAMDESALAFPAKALYLALRLYVRLSQEARGIRGDEDRALQEAIDRFSLYASTAQAETQSLRTQGPELEQRLQTLEAQVAERDQAVQALSTQVAERDQAVQALSTQVAERDQAVQALSTQVAEQRHQAQQLQTAKAALEAEAGRLRHHLEMLLNSLSWRLTAPFRRIHAGLYALGEGPRGLWRKGARGFQVLRELWYRTAYTVHPFRFMTPTEVEHSGAHSLEEAVRWIPAVRIGHQAKDAFLVHPPSRVTYRLTVPPRAVFRACVALLPEVWGRNPSGVEFTVSVSSRDNGRSLTRKRWSHPTRFPHHRRWLQLRMPLHRVADREVELTLSASVAPGASADFASAIWGDLMVLSRKPLGEIRRLAMESLRQFGVWGVLSRVMRVVSEETALTERPLAPVRIPRATLAKPEERPLAPVRIPIPRLVRPVEIPAKVSVVIPTKNGVAEDFESCLRAITQQKGLRELEIVVVDSGSADETVTIAKSYGAHIFSIPPEQFNHGGTRNYGGERASGELVVFTTQDAIPASDDLYYEMARMLLSDLALAAVSARQIPRSDADLFACWQNWIHFQYVGLDTGISHIDDLGRIDDMPPQDIRRAAGLDDVCSMHRKSIWDQLQYRQMAFAEDLEYGIRCLKAGHKIGFLGDRAVCHSHNRSAFYHLSKYYVDTITQLGFFKNADPLKWQLMGIDTIDQLLSCAKDVYGTLNAFGRSVSRSALYEPQAFSEQLRDFFVAYRQGGERLAVGEVTLDRLFSRLDGMMEFQTPSGNPIWDTVEGAIKNYITSYLSARYSSLSAEDMLDFAYKIYAMVVGADVGDYYAGMVQNGITSDNAEKINEMISYGIK